MTRKELIEQVALRMDEITPESGLTIAVDGVVNPVTGADENPLYELIDGLADDCALELYASAPYWRLPVTPFLSDEDHDEIKVEAIFPTNPNSRKMIRLKVTDSFLRLAVVKCAEFQRPVTDIYPEASPEGKRQHNRYLMGKEAKPVAVLTHGWWNGVPRREIDCYSLKADTSMAPRAGIEASYIPKPGRAETIPERLFPPLEWLIAARAFEARGDGNHGQICLNTAKSLLV